MEMMNEEKNTHIVFKIMLVVGAIFVLLTLLALVVCCVAYPSVINFFSPATLPPASVVLLLLYGFCVGIWGKIDIRKKYGTKYSKIDGKGYFERKDYPRTHKFYEGGAVSLFLMSLMLPFVFFFSDKIKYLAGGISLGVIAASLLVLFIVVFVVAMIVAKKQSERERAEAERHRREQEKREEMGQWK